VYGDDRVICYLGANDVSDDVYVLSWLLLCKMDQLGLAILDHLDHRLFHFVSWIRIMVNLNNLFHLKC